MTLHSRVLHQHKAWSRDTAGEEMLFMAAGLVQIRDGSSKPEWQNTTYWGDDPNDHYWIQQGFNYYNSQH